MLRSLAALFLAGSLLSGCYTPRRFPVEPVPVRLTSPRVFHLVQAATPTAPASTCEVLRAKLEVTALSADTLHFSHVTILRQPRGAEPCTHGAAGYVTLAGYPDVRAERPALSKVLTGAVLPLVVLPFVFVVVSVFSCFVCF